VKSLKQCHHIVASIVNRPIQMLSDASGLGPRPAAGNQLQCIAFSIGLDKKKYFLTIVLKMLYLICRHVCVRCVM
jgi:hypothetical protein